jgi:hypothetical protein
VNKIWFSPGVGKSNEFRLIVFSKTNVLEFASDRIIPFSLVDLQNPYLVVLESLVGKQGFTRLSFLDMVLER